MLGKLSALALAVLAISAAYQVAAQMQTPKHPRPATAPAAAPVETTQAPSQKVEGGPYPHQPPRMGKDVNSGAPPVPTNADSPATTKGASPGTDVGSAPE